jgi:hypothetical protein
MRDSTRDIAITLQSSGSVNYSSTASGNYSLQEE